MRKQVISQQLQFDTRTDESRIYPEQKKEISAIVHLRILKIKAYRGNEKVMSRDVLSRKTKVNIYLNGSCR